MPYQLGIDLGTTYTCAALIRDGRVEVCQLGQVSQLIPSVVSVREDGDVLTGEAAERRAVTHPERTVREFKRRFGDPAPVVLGGVPYGIERITSYVLSAVVAHVTQMEGQPPERVAVTHPASWGEYKLDLLREASRMAGIDDPFFVAEPVAAAVAYSTRTSVASGVHLLVYDFGGGTFDAAVVHTGSGTPEVVGTPAGLERFGGIDLDQAVLGHVDRATDGLVLRVDTEQPDVRGALSRLRHECTAAKEALSSDTEVEIPVLLPELRTAVRLTRVEFEAMLAPRLHDTIAISEGVVREAGLSLDQIDTILLVGGSSRIPLVAAVLREQTRRPVAVDTNPKFAVAAGAALLIGEDLGAPGAVAPAEALADVAEEPTSLSVGPTVPSPEPVAPPAEPAPTPARVPAPSPVSPSPARRRRWPLLAAVGVVVVAAVGAAVVLLGGGDDSSGDGGSLLPRGSATPLGAATVVFATSGDDGAQDLQLVEVDTGVVAPLVASAGFDGFPGVSPDRRLVAYAHTGEADPGSDARLALRVVNADGSGNARTLARDLAADAWVAWSPDGSEIVFPASEGGAIDLFVIDLESGSRRQLTDGEEAEADPTWSSDGSTIAYTFGPSDDAEIRAVAADGSDDPATLVASDGSDSNPAFSPTRDELAFTSTRNGLSQLFVDLDDGSGERPLLDGDAAAQFDPRWSPDGARLAILSIEGNAPRLVVVNADGTGRRDATPAGFQGQFSWSA